ncbi:MAG: NADPH-dependent FMN reductase [Haliea sp.]|uniref:flavodoxin family protein n=1 Tax=Haliea sp. TaxID=1932666 RepID=UPI000C504681|nr:flavodoxin family protein [Haliea sp.]MBM69483.1 NADPH-dependent FMN reductase [Haliea sp.]|tara:strand:+ start:210 stop:788 length:579 start_codon:yes stop_codon:yes gene_type:complete
MTCKVCVVYHSGYGHTQRVAESVVNGVNSVADTDCKLISANELDDGSPLWDELDSADAIIFGTPTYMGNVSADMKKFMDASSGRWMEMKWADKLAAGFTNSASQNGDKQNTLVTLATFAAQHGMVWINLNQAPGNNHSGGSVEDVNRLGASLGAMAQSNADEGPDTSPLQSDLKTADLLGERVAKCALRWQL